MVGGVGEVHYSTNTEPQLIFFSSLLEFINRKRVFSDSIGVF